MSRWIDAAGVSDLPPGRGKVVEVAGRRLALFRVGESEWRCIDDTCPHRGASLAEGELIDGGRTVSCPWHSWPFSLCDGRSGGSDFWKVETYPVEVSDGRVGVRVPDDWAPAGG
jgi:nitrite reductase (NADH) small subunit/3-phenylpropionate/trans-cinnamate dioxygenase ferredoxin subunit